MTTQVTDRRSGGLSEPEVMVRRQRDGSNILPRRKGRPVVLRIGEQLVHFFALMLWVAGALAFVAGMPALGLAIFLVVLINAAFSFAQEFKAERAAERLRALLPVQVNVRRGGQRTIVDATELVVDDVVLLQAGDRVPADVVVDVQHGFGVDTSAFTGESGAVTVNTGDVLPGGSFVVRGEADTYVVATGNKTQLASIAALTQSEKRREGPLSIELRRVVRIVAAIAVGLGAAFWAISVLVGTPSSDALIFAIGVTVALVPEGLLPTVTLSLAIGAQRMAGRSALVRRLESVETLGSTTFICTDKTGTLTRNEMTVVEVWTPRGSAVIDGVGYGPDAVVHVDKQVASDLARVAKAAVICSNGEVQEQDGQWVPIGDPMEAALHTLALRTGLTQEIDDVRMAIVRRCPFDEDRRRMSVVTAEQVIVKGAADSLLSRCVNAGVAGDVVTVMGERGLRVLAIAERPANANEPTDIDVLENKLELLGLVAFQDPPRTDVAESLAACRRAGIKVAMVTGDHPATARAIAQQVGLLGADELVLVGHDLPDDDAVLGALIDRDGVVISRITPEGKLRIARVLQERGHVVAMTGDGVNDGPALQHADIGIAMGESGTDVAREAADLVLLDDHFGTIVAAIELGRATFSNVRRFLTYHLTDNVAELTPFVIWALSGGKFPLAIGVLQVLCLDIGTDLLPALALGAEPPDAHVLQGPPPKRHLLDGVVLRRVFVHLGPVEAICEMTAFLVAMMLAGWRPGDAFPTGNVLAAASGAAFSAVVFAQMANAFACRSARKSPWQLGWTTNRLLLWAVAAELVALVMFLFVGPVARQLGHAAPPAAAAAVALMAAPVLLAADWFEKRRRVRNSGNSADV